MITNCWHLCQWYREIVKLSTWGVRRQRWNSKELTGVRTSGGACGLIRRYARNLTWARMWRNVSEMVQSAMTWNKVLHGCRQLVPWGVGLSPATSATPVVSCHQVMLGTLTRLPTQVERKEGTTSSHHGPYAQGNTRATMDGTAGRYVVTQCQSTKPFSVRIGVCNSTLWSWNR